MRLPQTPQGAVALLVTIVVVVGEIVLAAAQQWGMAIIVATMFALAADLLRDLFAAARLVAPSSACEVAASAVTSPQPKFQIFEVLAEVKSLLLAMPIFY